MKAVEDPNINQLTEEIRISKTTNSRITEMDEENLAFGKMYSDHMLISDYKNGQWTNIRIVPYGNLSISPANTTLHYAQSIFEGLKAYKDEDNNILVFRPDANAKRMQVSARRMCIPELPEELFLQGMSALLEQDRDWVPKKEGTSLYIRPFVFATDPYIGIRPSDNYQFMIITSPVGAYYNEPVKVKIETHYTRAIKGGIGFVKTAGNYAAALYPAVEARKEGYHQLIWTDGQFHEYIEESGTMNIMFLIDDKLITAPTGGTILAGITRDSILTLAKHWGVDVEVRPITVKEIIEAIKNKKLQEAFGVGTAATIAHIKSIGYDGVDYDLPIIETRGFSSKVLETLDQIKTGKATDPFGWIFKI